MKREFRDRLMTYHNSEKSPEKVDGSEKEIRELQERKKKIMSELKERIKYIEENQEFEPDTKHIWNVERKEDRYIAKDGKGAEKEVTKGDILTDFTWGIGYRLDPNSVPYLLRKEYAIILARHKLLQLTDRQIIAKEKASDKDRKNTFNVMHERMEKEDWALGHLAERFVINYLKKIVIDLDLPFEVMEVDIFEDVEDKIDFIIRSKKRAMGIDVEISDDQQNTVAVQLTLKDRKEQVLKKKAIMEEAIFDRGPKGDIKIDTAALLYISEKWVRRALGKWKHRRLSEDSESPAPGGPERLLDDQGQRDLIYRVFDGLLSEEEIDDISKKLGIYSNKKVRDWRKEEPSKKLREKLAEIRKK